MATAARFPGDDLFSLTCDTASVLEGAVLVQGASNDTIALPSAASSRSKVIGLAYQAGSSSTNDAITIVPPGRVWPGIAAGTITRGDIVVVGGATGTVVSRTLATPPDASIVGVAMESAVSGSRVAILIGATGGFSAGGTVLTMTAGVGGVTANAACMAAADTAVLPGGASPTAALLGISLNTAAAGATCYVVISGSCVMTCGAGAGVTANDRLTVSGAGGLGLTAAPGAGTNCAIVGIALTTTLANGAITVAVMPSTIQG